MAFKNRDENTWQKQSGDTEYAQALIIFGPSDAMILHGINIQKSQCRKNAGWGKRLAKERINTLHGVEGRCGELDSHTLGVHCHWFHNMLARLLETTALPQQDRWPCSGVLLQRTGCLYHDTKAVP